MIAIENAEREGEKPTNEGTRPLNAGPGRNFFFLTPASATKFPVSHVTCAKETLESRSEDIGTRNALTARMIARTKTLTGHRQPTLSIQQRDPQQIFHYAPPQTHHRHPQNLPFLPRPQPVRQPNWHRQKDHRDRKSVV